MKHLALTLVVAVAASMTFGNSASASDRSHGQRGSSVGHAVGHLIFGGHSYGNNGTSYGQSYYRSPSNYGTSTHNSPSYSRGSYGYSTYGSQGYGSQGHGNSNYGHRGSSYGGHRYVAPSFSYGHHGSRH